MAIEYNNIILNINRKPSPKSIMVAIPMNMYRIETNEFSYGLNFFQKTILKFKSYPGILDEAIADYIGLDPKLIGLIVTELKAKGFISEYGSLNKSGKEKLWQIDGLTINSGEKKIGYFFKYVNQDKLYQYYTNKIIPADLIEGGLSKYPKIITGTKGDGEDYTESPTFLEEMYKSKKNLPSPDERAILQAIENSNKKIDHLPDSNNENIEKLTKHLAIRFLNDQPELIWLCTYIYLQERDDSTYEPDWRVLDPFGFGDNIALKFYLNDPINKNLLGTIEKRFSNEKTLGGKILSDFQEHLNEIVEKKILDDFQFGLTRLDPNLQQYIHAIVKNYILQQNQEYNDLDSSVVFSLNLQNALENMLKQDQEIRSSVYQMVFDRFETYNKKFDFDAKFNSLKNIYRLRLFSRNTYVPQKLRNAANSLPSRANSLLSYLVTFILTYDFDKKSPLFRVFKERIDLIIEVAQLRNEKGHGQISAEKLLSPLSKEEVEKYYSFIKSLINEYIQNLDQYHEQEKQK